MNGSANQTATNYTVLAFTVTMLLYFHMWVFLSWYGSIFCFIEAL